MDRIAVWTRSIRIYVDQCGLNVHLAKPVSNQSESTLQCEYAYSGLIQFCAKWIGVRSMWIEPGSTLYTPYIMSSQLAIYTLYTHPVESCHHLGLLHGRHFVCLLMILYSNIIIPSCERFPYFLDPMLSFSSFFHHSVKHHLYKHTQGNVLLQELHVHRQHNLLNEDDI